MTRVSVVVEGQTEESFVNQVLAPLLWPRELYTTSIIIGVPGHKGGRTSYARVKKDVLLQLKQDRTAYCTTMLDLYGLGKGFPGDPPPPNVSNLEKVTRLEEAVLQDIITTAPELRADVRFLPYLQLHEYEGLLFSDAAAFAAGIHQPHLAAPLQAIRNQFQTPEDINDNVETAPSKRVLKLYPLYRKPLDGTRAAQAVGVAIMRQECPHFNAWVLRLESLANAPAAGQFE
jgi:hypothetical protein